MDAAESPVAELAQRLAAAYSALPEVQAVALGGSRAGPFEPDVAADLDLYVYRTAEIPETARAQVVSPDATGIEISNAFWEDSDEWRARVPPVNVDVMFRDTAWIEGEVARVLDRREARLGYTTCFLHNVRTSIALYDRRGWLAALQQRANQPYPSALRDAILAKNHPVLRNAQSSYVHQLESAAARDDTVSLQHRSAALLASYFDIVFAVNRKTHPGEKRMLRAVERDCDSKPDGLERDVTSLLRNAAHGHDIVGCAHQLLDALDEWLGALGLLPPWPRARG